MMLLWIILGIIVIPAVLNILYIFITVKFSLWNWVAEMALRDGGNAIDKSSVYDLILPIYSLFVGLTIIFCNLGTLVYYVIKYALYPFIKLIELISDACFVNARKIEDKIEFYEKLNNH